MLWPAITCAKLDIEKFQNRNKDLERMCTETGKKNEFLRENIKETRSDLKVAQIALKKTADELNQIKSHHDTEVD